MKVSIKSKKIQENYIVFNTDNKEYNIILSKDNKTITIDIKNGKKKVKDSEGKEYTGEIKYDYTDTDIYLTGVNITDSEIDSSELTIGKEKYTKYNFKITKEKFNKIMNPFNIEAKTDGNGYTYIDKNNHIYLINYNISGINVNVSYTNIKNK